MSRAVAVVLSLTFEIPAALAQPCSYGAWVGPGDLLLTAQFYSPTGPSSCAASRDAWLRYLPQAAGTLSVTPTNFDNAGMLALYASCPQGPGEELICVSAPPGASSGFSLAVQPLVTYYLRVGMADFGDYAFTIAGPPAARVVGLDGAAGQYSSIQEAIDAAQDGDTIVVQPGEYTGDLYMVGRSLRIFGAAGAAQTRVAAGLVLADSKSDLSLERLTIAYATVRGTFSSQITARACVFSGAGLSAIHLLSGSGGNLYNCVIRNCNSGVLTLGNDAVTLTNCTLVANGVAVRDDDPVGQSARLTNCVVRNNALAFAGEYVSSVATYSNIQGGWPGEGNIDADARFVDPDGADDVPGNLDDDYRLLPDSPCIDAGDVYALAGLFDLVGAPRAVDHPAHSNAGGWPAAIDMGAYEAQPPVCAADLDGDGSVGIADLSILLTVYGTMCP